MNYATFQISCVYPRLNFDMKFGYTEFETSRNLHCHPSNCSVNHKFKYWIEKGDMKRNVQIKANLEKTWPTYENLGH